jgi:hypothetical protein
MQHTTPTTSPARWIAIGAILVGLISCGIFALASFEMLFAYDYDGTGFDYQRVRDSYAPVAQLALWLVGGAFIALIAAWLRISRLALLAIGIGMLIGLVFLVYSFLTAYPI